MDGFGEQWVATRNCHFPRQRPLFQSLVLGEHLRDESHGAVHGISEIAWLRRNP